MQPSDRRWQQGDVAWKLAFSIASATGAAPGASSLGVVGVEPHRFFLAPGDAGGFNLSPAIGQGRNGATLKQGGKVGTSVLSCWVKTRGRNSCPAHGGIGEGCRHRPGSILTVIAQQVTVAVN
jgi:hypothetical protein